MQAEGAFEHAVEFGEGAEGFLDGGGEAGFGGDDEGQAVFGVAGALQEGVDVGSDFGECAGDGGDDTGLIVYYEAKVVRGEEFAGDLAFADGELDGLAALRDGEEVGDYGDCCGFAARAVAGEDYISAEAAADYDHVLRAV